MTRPSVSTALSAPKAAKTNGYDGLDCQIFRCVDWRGYRSAHSQGAGRCHQSQRRQASRNKGRNATEQARRRPALVLSPQVFNELTDRIATRSLALCKPTNCAAPHGSSEDRVLYARLPLAWLTKYERGSSRCSRFNRAAGLRACGEACSKADWIRISVETQALTAGKWILNRQLINHLPCCRSSV
jgi:hypothetical protein